MVKHIFDTSEVKPVKDDYYIGMRDICVKMTEYPRNPYRSIFTMALATWGSHLNKWNLCNPEERYQVVKAALEKRALPLGLESPIFMFEVENVSRSSFDQIARQRVGTTFASLGWNNVHTETPIRIPDDIATADSELFLRTLRILKDTKSLYHDLIESGVSWMSARTVLPMGLSHRFCMSITYMAFQQFCARRLCFSEQPDTVAATWLMRERIKERFPLLSYYLRPSCDFAKRCVYKTGNTLPEDMGSLFKSCERNPCSNNEKGVFFNHPCTIKTDLEVQCTIKIPLPWEDRAPETLENLTDIDKEMFSAH